MGSKICVPARLACLITQTNVFSVDGEATSIKIYFRQTVQFVAGY